MCGALASRYSAGRELFADQFLMAREIMSGTPLERFWSARTVGALVQVGVNWTSLRRGIQVRLGASLDASKWRHPMATDPTSHCNGRCKQIKPSRILAGGNVDDGYDLGQLKLGVMYYCLEDTKKQRFDCYRSTFRSRSVMPEIGRRIHGPMCSTSRAAMATGQVAQRA